MVLWERSCLGIYAKSIKALRYRSLVRELKEFQGCNGRNYMTVAEGLVEEELREREVGND